MENKDKVLAALGSSDNPSPTTSDDNAKHTESVWAGRARVLADEKKALSDENKELRARIERLESSQHIKTATDNLTPEQIGDTPRDFIEASGALASNLVREASDKTHDEIANLRAEIAERDKKIFLAEISRNHSSFFDEVAPGCEKADLWDKFRASNKETFDAIMASHDSSRFNSFVNMFYREIGVSNPSATKAAPATPSPVQAGGTLPVVDTSSEKTYTQAEFAALEKKADEFRALRKFAEYEEICRELNAILSEGRIRE